MSKRTSEWWKTEAPRIKRRCWKRTRVWNKCQTACGDKKKLNTTTTDDKNIESNLPHWWWRQRRQRRRRRRWWLFATGTAPFKWAHVILYAYFNRATHQFRFSCCCFFFPLRFYFRMYVMLIFLYLFFIVTCAPSVLPSLMNMRWRRIIMTRRTQCWWTLIVNTDSCFTATVQLIPIAHLIGQRGQIISQQR